VEIILSKKILDLDPTQLARILTELQMKHRDAFEELKEAVEDAV
jgi:hypothetical protein